MITHVVDPFARPLAPAFRHSVDARIGADIDRPLLDVHDNGQNVRNEAQSRRATESGRRRYASLNEAMSAGFDVQLAMSSLLFFDLRQIPAVRGALPAGVSDVHFRSDLTTATPLAPSELENCESALFELLPESFC